MKKLFSSLGLMVVAMGFFASQAVAQNQPLSNQLIKPNLSQVRFLVNAPASLNGLKKASIASWGGQASPALLNIPVARGIDSLAANPLTNPSAIAGKACLLFRGGGISFAQKAQYAVAAGAVAVIIVNNVPGDPIAMGNTGTATYTVPIVMITNTDGIALNNAIIGGGSVNVSIGSWNLNVTHDLAILPGYQSVPHSMNIPYSQLAAGYNRLPNKNFVGGAVINYGTASETNLAVADTVTWTPTGGSATPIHTSSYTVPNIAPADSVKFGFGNAASAWTLTAPTGTGKYTYKYNLSFANTDQIPQDNIYSFDQYVTDSIFCKGVYDYTKNQPHISLGIQPSGITNAYSMGPMYYMAKGKYYARKMQFYMSKNNVTTLDGEEAYALLFKWVDGANGQPVDSFAEGDELTLVGLTRKTFTTADSNGFVFTVDVKDANRPTNPVILDSNAWYWASVQASSNCFVGVDESVSYFTRSYIQSQQTGYVDMPELLFTQDYSGLGGSSTALAPFPFGGSAYNIDSTYFDRFYEISNVALHISKNQASSTGPGGVNTVGSDIGKLIVSPTPASSVVTVNLTLNKTSAKAEYRLLDISGKPVYKLDHENVKSDRFDIPVDCLPSGIYYLAVFTENGQATEKVVIRH